MICKTPWSPHVFARRKNYWYFKPILFLLLVDLLHLLCYFAIKGLQGQDFPAADGTGRGREEESDCHTTVQAGLEGQGIFF